MAGVDALHLAVHVTNGEAFTLVEAGETEAPCRSTVSKAGVVMDVNAVARCLAVAVDLEDAPFTRVQA